MKAYTNQIKAGKDKVIHITFDRESTNQYRDDIQFRQHLMNTTYTLRFTKLIIGQDKDGQDIVELLMSNLPEDEYSMDNFKFFYFETSFIFFFCCYTFYCFDYLCYTLSWYGLYQKIYMIFICSYFPKISYRIYSLFPYISFFNSSSTFVSNTFFYNTLGIKSNIS